MLCLPKLTFFMKRPFWTPSRFYFLGFIFLILIITFVSNSTSGERFQGKLELSSKESSDYYYDDPVYPYESFDPKEIVIDPSLVQHDPPDEEETAPFRCSEESLVSDDFEPFGSKKVLVVLVQYSGESYNSTYGEDYVGDLMEQLNNHLYDDSYYSDEEFGLKIGEFDVVGPYSVSQGPMSGVSRDEIFEQALAEGVDVPSYNALFFFGSSGGQYYETHFMWEDQCLVKPLVWAGYESADFNKILYTFAHEYHHTFLGHANFLDCGTKTLEKDISQCPLIVTYGDKTSVMDGSLGYLNASHRRDLGWLYDSEKVYITQDGTYTIGHRLSDSNVKKVAIVPWYSINKKQFLGNLNLEFIQPLNFDSSLTKDAYGGLVGTLFYYDEACAEERKSSGYLTDSTCRQSLLLDFQPQEAMLPCSGSAWDSAGFPVAEEGEACENPNKNFSLHVGQTFYDTTTGIAIKTLSMTDKEITFSVDVPVRYLRYIKSYMK